MKNNIEEKIVTNLDIIKLLDFIAGAIESYKDSLTMTNKDVTPTMILQGLANIIEVSKKEVE